MTTPIESEITALREQAEMQGREIAELRGSVRQLETATSREATLRIIIVAGGFCLLTLCLLYFQAR